MRPRKRRKGILVCFVGIDGAGKSTLAKSLIRVLEEQGIKCNYVWGGFNASFMIFRPLIVLMKSLVFRGNSHMKESETKGRVLKSSRLSAVYQYLVLVDYVVQAFVRIRVPLAFGRAVICDRYIYDLATSVAVLLDYPSHKALVLLDRCLRFVPEPDQVFLLDLPERLAYQRKDTIVSLDFLSVRRSVYVQMAQQHGMTILDGGSDPRKLEDLAAGQVLQYMAEES